LIGAITRANSGGHAHPVTTVTGSVGERECPKSFFDAAYSLHVLSSTTEDGWLNRHSRVTPPDSPQESANGTEPTSSAAQPVTTPTASSSKSTPAPNRKGGPKVDAFLASLQTTGSHPSLEDLERGRPREYAHPESTLYAKQYNEVMEHLGRSFTKEQLRRFAEKYQLDPRLWRSHRRKVDYARAIVENAWGWPSLRDIEKKKREKTEVVTESKQI
jgi:hypothetical protein